MTVDHPPHHVRSVYIDVELSCWAGPPPAGMKQEIIEIGLVEMDLATLNITRQRSHFVRPKRWDISDRCTKLTGITNDDIRIARPFPDVIASLAKEFSPSTALCCTWGNDGGLIATSCREHGLRSPLRNLLDLAELFQGLLFLKQTPSLRKVVTMLELEFDGVPHGALADARNTASVHAAVLRRMRRELDPLPVAAQEIDEEAGLTPFGQKLRHALDQRTLSR